MKKILVLLAVAAFVLAFGTAFAYEGMATTGMSDKDSLINYLDPSNADFDAHFAVVTGGSGAGGIIPDENSLLADIDPSQTAVLNGPVKGVAASERENILEW
jgi:hypothetical protein